MMKRFFPILLLALLLCGCTHKVAYTTVSIKDPIRHDYPILRGQELTLAVRVDNTGKVPLVIKDIQSSCGCIVVDSGGEKVVPPDRFIYVLLRYDSRKNVGKVEHAVRFWGNILPAGMAEMRFDVNVVPDANYHHDYEELVEKDRRKELTIRDFVDGVNSETGLGYYVD